MNEEAGDMARRNKHRSRLTPDDRARFARERRALVGSLLTQEGFEGALVLEHIRGSQYLVRLGDGTQVYMSHKKQIREDDSVISSGGWKLWKDRNESR